MRRVRYQVAASLDGYIAGPRGEYDWIVSDPEIDFAALFAQFDTFLLGRRTFEGLAATGMSQLPGTTVVFSRTLRQADHPGVIVAAGAEAEIVHGLKAKPGKDIWLFGGGKLFRSLLELGLVDSVEIAVVPVLLGAGRPLLPTPAPSAKLALTGSKIYRASGIALLQYDVVR